MTCRFEYSYHKTREQAEAALEEYYALGEVCEGERPAIEARKSRSGGRIFAVTLDA